MSERDELAERLRVAEWEFEMAEESLAQAAGELDDYDRAHHEVGSTDETEPPA